MKARDQYAQAVMVFADAQKDPKAYAKSIAAAKAAMNLVLDVLTALEESRPTGLSGQLKWNGQLEKTHDPLGLLAIASPPHRKMTGACSVLFQLFMVVTGLQSAKLPSDDVIKDLLDE